MQIQFYSGIDLTAQFYNSYKQNRSLYEIIYIYSLVITYDAWVIEINESFLSQKYIHLTIINVKFHELTTF